MVVSGIGGITALYGAIAGIYQNDIKRIIAYSTASQLGWKKNSDNDSKDQAGIFKKEERGGSGDQGVRKQRDESISRKKRY